MKKKSKQELLQEAISILENKKALELKLLKEEIHHTYESLKPINLLKSTLHEITTSPEIKSGILKNAVGMATDFISKKVLGNNPVKILIGSVLQSAISSIVSKNADAIITSGENIMDRILKAKGDHKQEFYRSEN